MLCEQDNCRNYAVKGTTRCFVHKNFVLYLFNCLQRGKADEYIKYYKKIYGLSGLSFNLLD